MIGYFQRIHSIGKLLVVGKDKNIFFEIDLAFLIESFLKEILLTCNRIDFKGSTCEEDVNLLGGSIEKLFGLFG